MTKTRQEVIRDAHGRVPTGILTGCIIALLVMSACASGGRRARAGGTPAVFSSSPTVEAQDRVLATAILQAAIQPSADRLVRVGYRYYQLGIRDKAMEYFSRALDKTPKYAAAFDGRARIWRDWGLMTLAVSDAHRAVYFAPRSAAAHNTLGTVLQGMGRNVDAAEAYARAGALDTTALYAINNLCYLAFLDGHIETAIRRCDEAIQMNEAFAPARNNLALAYAAQGEFQQAWKHFVRASGEAVAHYNVGIVHLADKQYDAAVREFQAAYRVDPSFDAAHRRARQARVLAHGQPGGG